MAKKNYKTHSIVSQPSTPISQNPSSGDHKSMPPKVWILCCLIGLLSILLYSNTFQHRFVLDDQGIIKGNKITKAPLSWENTKTIFTTSLRKGQETDLENSLYRPFVKLFFNLEWNIFGEDPHAFHVVQVLLYAFTCILFFLVLYRIFERKWLLPLLISLLFVAHPLHVETVANIKSGDEIWSLLGILIALRCLQLYFDLKKWGYLFLAVFAFLIGSFSKESTVVAVAIFPIFMYYFTNADKRKNLLLSSLFAACSGFFLYCRWSALHVYKNAIPVSLMDNFMAQQKDDFWGRFPSAVQTLGYYLKLFFIPHPLSCDYSYSTFQPIPASHPYFLLSFLILSFVFVYAILTLRKKQGIGFGILWFFLSISIVSNIFFLIGTGCGERLMFTPSVGLCIAFVLLLYRYLPGKKEENGGMIQTLKQNPALTSTILLVCLVYSYKTYERNEAWSSDFKLFSTDIQNFPNSTHLLYFMAKNLSDDFRKGMTVENMTQEHFNAAQIQDSIRRDNLLSIQYFNRALSIFPALPGDGYNQLGKAYFNIGNIDSASKYYQRAMRSDSSNASYINNLGTIFFLNGLNDAGKARDMYSLRKNDSAEWYYSFAKKKIMDSKQYFIKAIQLDTSRSDFCNNLGSAYGESLMPDSAIYWFNHAARIDEYDTVSRKFLDMTYRRNGDIQRADSAHHEYVMASQKSIERMNKNKY